MPVRSDGARVRRILARVGVLELEAEHERSRRRRRSRAPAGGRRRGAADEERDVGERLRSTTTSEAEAAGRASGRRAYPDDTIGARHGLPPHGRAGAAEAQRARVRRSRASSARARMGRGAALSARRSSPSAPSLGLMGIQFPDAYGGAAMSSVDYCICIEELARVDPAVCLSIAAHNGLGRRAHLPVRHRGAEAALPGAARARRAAGRVGADRGVVGQRRGVDAHRRPCATAPTG